MNELNELKIGDIIEFDLDSILIKNDERFSNQYRVISLDGDEALVVAMYTPIRGRMEFGKTCDYKDSNVDHYLNGIFYYLIHRKDVIVEKEIKQDVYYYDSDRYNTDTNNAYEGKDIEPESWSYVKDDKIIEEREVGKRFVYALSYEDIAKYFKEKGLKYSQENIFKFLFNDKKEPNDIHNEFWLRTDIKDVPYVSRGNEFEDYLSKTYKWDQKYLNSVLNYSCSIYGQIRDSIISRYLDVRPAFVVDLSLIDFKIVYKDN